MKLLRAKAPAVLLTALKGRYSHFYRNEGMFRCLQVEMLICSLPEVLGTPGSHPHVFLPICWERFPGAGRGWVCVYVLNSGVHL